MPFHQVTAEEWAEREHHHIEEQAYLSELAAAEDKDPNFCTVRKWDCYPSEDEWRCHKHDRVAEHTTISGRVVCDVYASTDPGCDPHECCPRDIEGED